VKANKEQFFKQIKVAGIVACIPFVLAAGPLAGHFVGEYLRIKFKLGPAVSIICITIGFISGAVETVRLIKLISKIDKD
jgi:hypothetical protein